MVMKKSKAIIRSDKKTAVSTKPSDKGLLSLVSEINRKFGENAIYLGFPRDKSGEIPAIRRIKTGSVSLDIALGGGIPVGRYTEISGGLSSTKTSQALHIIREAQKLGYVCAFVDVEATTTEDFAEAIGIDVSSLIYSQPAGMEEATQLILDLQRDGRAQLGVIDSLAAMSPNRERDSAMDETVRMGIVPNLLNEFFRKFQMNNNKLTREGAEPFTLICINQLRERIGAYGDSEYAPGGRGKGFAASVDLRFRKSDWISEGRGEQKGIVGQAVSFRIDKNKTYRRMQSGQFDYYFAENEAGVSLFHNDYIKDIIVCAVQCGVIIRAGAWFTYKSRKWQGLETVVSALRDDSDAVDLLYSEVMKTVVAR
jgi:recombination protein RecA